MHKKNSKTLDRNLSAKDNFFFTSEPQAYVIDIANSMLDKSRGSKVKLPDLSPYVNINSPSTTRQSKHNLTVQSPSSSRNHMNILNTVTSPKISRINAVNLTKAL